MLIYCLCRTTCFFYCQRVGACRLDRIGALPVPAFYSKVLFDIAVTLLCATYAVLVSILLQPGDLTEFGSLAGITALLSNPDAALAGWIHYLAFDLLAGLFLVNNAAKHGISMMHGYYLVLLLTFILGPIWTIALFFVSLDFNRYYFADISEFINCSG
jgi:hypothetical protein